MRRQRTIKREMECRGVGLHTGQPVRMRLRPAPPDTGIIFRRLDLEHGRVPIRASVEKVTDFSHSTSLRENGACVRTVEHILAALSGLHVDNCAVELDAEEVPIMDGSAVFFVKMLTRAGLADQEKRQPHLQIRDEIVVSDGDRRIAIRPSPRNGASSQPGGADPSLAVRCRIEFDHPLIAKQSYSYAASSAAFTDEIAQARTFGFLRDLPALRAQGLARGGSLANAVVVGPKSILNPEGLRYEDEFVRHKVLDLLGDLALVGMPIAGEVIAERSGHALHVKLVEQLARLKTAWACQA